MKLTVESAGRAIGAILEQLETDTGETVESIRLSQVEVTGLQSALEEYAICVLIDMFRTPGHRWAT